jgi:adenosine kinase
VFEDHFKNHILPDQTHILNVSFLTPQMQRFEGGCAGNIAYNLNLLGGDPVIMATVGEDFEPYAQRLKSEGISTEHITEIEGQYTAQAYIITDLDNNQITSFHPGAMNFAHQNKVGDAQGIEFGIVGPDGRDAMIQHAELMAEAQIPFFFDPGQGLPLFNGEELLRFFEQATYAIANDYELQLIVDKTGQTIEQLAEMVEALVVTLGGQGSRVYSNGEVIEIPSAPISEAKDPTGCGDAYRGGLLYGLANGLDWQSSGRIAALCGAIKIETAGTQSHKFTREEFAERYASAFSLEFPVSI